MVSLMFSFALDGVYYETDRDTLNALRDARLDAERGRPERLARMLYQGILAKRIKEVRREDGKSVRIKR